MGCRVIRNDENQISLVYNEQGQVSRLFNQLSEVLPSEIAYTVYSRVKVQHPGVEPTYEQSLPFINDALQNPVAYKTVYDESEVAITEDKLSKSLISIAEDLGFDIEIIDNIRNKEGNILPVSARARITQKVIQLVAGKAKAKDLTEEVAHVLVETLRLNDSSLYKAMYKDIDKYQIFQDIIQPDNFYYKKYKGDMDMLRREAIGKVIALHVMGSSIGKAEEFSMKEESENVGRLKRWWTRLVNWFKKTFGKALANPYIQASERILNRDIEEYLEKEGKLNGRLKDQVFEEGLDFYSETQDPREDSIKKLDEISEEWALREDVNVEKYLEEHPEWVKLSDDGVISRYYNAKLNKFLKWRTTDQVTIMNNKKYANIQRTKEEQEYFELLGKIRTTGGTLFHNVLEQLIDYHTKKPGALDPKTIKAQSGLSASQFEELHSVARNLLLHGQKQQNQIDPNKKVTVRTEQFTLNPTKQEGGKIDVLFIFSDNSFSLYDFKFKTPSTLNKGQAIKQAVGYKILKDFYADSIDQYDMQMSAHVEKLIKFYGLKEAREIRIIPGSVVYKYDADGMPTGTILDLQMGGPFLNRYERNPSRKKKLEQSGQAYRMFLDPIPVAGERPRDPITGEIMTNLDDLIILEQRRLSQLKEELKEANYKESQILKQRIKNSNFIIRNMQVNQEIGYALVELNNIINRLDSGVGIMTEYDADKKRNPQYLDDLELVDLYNDAKYYQTYLGQSKYMEWFKKHDKKKHDALVEATKVTSRINRVLDAAKMSMLNRAILDAEKRGIKGIDSFNIKQDYLTSNLVALSKQGNPFQRVLYDIINTIHTKLNKVSKELAIEIEDKEKAFLQTARDKYGLVGPAAYDLIIDTDRMKLFSKYNPQFLIDKEKALNLARAGDSLSRKKALAWIKKYYQIDEKKYNELYSKWRKNAHKAIEKTNLNKTEQNRKKAAWDKRWDLKKSEDAWFNKKNLSPTGLATLTNSANKYLSDDYIRIQQDPAIRDFYEYHNKMVWVFSKMFGKELGNGFIASIHKDMIDTWVQDGMSLGSMSQSMMDILQVREHDLTFGMTDTEGNILRKVPRLHIRMTEDKAGNPDASLKSKDLGKSLYMLGMAAYNYKLKTEIIPTLLTLETLLNDKIVKELAVNKKGDIVMETLQRAKLVPNEAGPSTFGDFVNMEIFGRSMKTKDAMLFGTSVSRNKSILALKTYATINALGFRLPVALGAFGAGMVGLEIQASKKLFFNRSQLRKAQGLILSKDPKVRALAEFFDISLEDLRQRRGDLLSASTRAKYMQTDRWFEFLARADKLIDTTLLIAMAQNYGIDLETGKVERLQDLPKGTASILDAMKFEEDPKWKDSAIRDRYNVTIPGFSMDDKVQTEFDAYRIFKARVRDQSTSVKGTIDVDDKLLVNSTLIGKLMLHYRSWLPGLALERFGNLRYNYIMDHFAQGTWGSLFGSIGKEQAFETLEDAVGTEMIMHTTLKNTAKDIMTVALDVGTFGMVGHVYKVELAEFQFNQFLQNRFGEPQFMKEGRLIKKGDVEYEAQFKKFVEFKRGNIRGAISEIRAVILLALLLIGLGGDWDDDGTADLRESWTGRKLHMVLNRTYREVAFFWDPLEITGPRATGIPLLSIGQNLYKWVGNSADEMGDAFFGEDDNPDRSPAFKYTFKFIPPLDGVGKAFEVYPGHKGAQH